MPVADSKWIWLDARYTVAEAARVCCTDESVIRWSLVDGRLKALPDGRIAGLALFIWFRLYRFDGLNGDV